MIITLLFCTKKVGLQMTNTMKPTHSIEIKELLRIADQNGSDHKRRIHLS